MIENFTYTDIGIVALLFIFFISGVKRGFIDTLLGLIGGLVSLVVAILLAEKVVEIISPLFGMGDAINGSVRTLLMSSLAGNDSSSIYAVPILDETKIQELVDGAIGKFGLPATFTSGISASITGALQSFVQANGLEILQTKSLIDILTPIIGHIIMLVIAVILTFIVIRIVVAIIEAITKAILRTSKSLRGLNRLLGGIIGAAEGALAVVIIFTIGSFFLTGDTSTGIKAQIKANIDQSTIGKYVYEINPVPAYITSNINLDSILGKIMGIFGGNNNPQNTQQPEE